MNAVPLRSLRLLIGYHAKPHFVSRRHFFFPVMDIATTRGRIRAWVSSNFTTSPFYVFKVHTPLGSNEALHNARANSFAEGCILLSAT